MRICSGNIYSVKQVIPECYVFSALKKACKCEGIQQVMEPGGRRQCRLGGILPAVNAAVGKDPEAFITSEREDNFGL